MKSSLVKSLALNAAQLGWGVVQPAVTRRLVQVKELVTLSPYACRSTRSRGRVKPETACDFRTDFARDIGRITYSEYFARLSGKTQVFSKLLLSFPTLPVIHHRLTHVIKVADVAKTICRALGLNEDLAQAIALGHDFGHPPFGHEGERILSELSQQHLGRPFKHNRHSLRVVDQLAINSRGQAGLNLCFEVRDGIIKHDGERKDPIIRPSQDYSLSDAEFPVTLEGCVVRLADRIAYLPMDLEDALVLELIRPDQLPSAVTSVLGWKAGQIMDTVVRDVIAQSRGHNYITMSEPVRKALDALFAFNYEHIYYSEQNMAFKPQVRQYIEGLFNYYTTKEGQSAEQAIDTIAKMTDSEAVWQYEKF